MKPKPEDKHFKNSGEVLHSVSNSQRKGSGKKIGAPALALVEAKTDDGKKELD